VQRGKVVDEVATRVVTDGMACDGEEMGNEMGNGSWNEKEGKLEQYKRNKMEFRELISDRSGRSN